MRPPSGSRGCGLLVLAATLIGVTGPAVAETWRVTVRGAGGMGVESPVVVEAPAGVAVGRYALGPVGRGPELPALVFIDAGKTYLGVVLPPPQGGDPRPQLRLRPVLAAEWTTPGVAIRALGPNLEVSEGGRPWTTYLTDQGPKPCYFPLFGPGGAAMTRAYPIREVAGEDRDHPHHRSLWFTHGLVNGIDFWGEAKGHGTIRETARRTVVADDGPVGLIRTTDDWLGPDGAKLCEDERLVVFYQGRNPAARVFDVDVTLKATAGPLTLGATKEGTFGLRVASTMDVTAKPGPGGKITNAEGLTDADAWGKPSAWVGYAGPVAGRTVGVTIMNHPESFRFPTAWHVRTYGLFAANPFGGREFGPDQPGALALPAGGRVRFRYRLILHEGDTASTRPAAAFQAYAHPPGVFFEPE